MDLLRRQCFKTMKHVIFDIRPEITVDCFEISLLYAPLAIWQQFSFSLVATTFGHHYVVSPIQFHSSEYLLRVPSEFCIALFNGTCFQKTGEAMLIFEDKCNIFSCTCFSRY